LADEMRILGTYGNELGNTSRHILYYTKVLFFYISSVKSVYCFFLDDLI
jgi:hypothetical protein